MSKYKVKVVEATSPYDLEDRINAALENPDCAGFEVMDIKYIMTPMPGGKVSRGGIFYTASILFSRGRDTAPLPNSSCLHK